MSPYGELNEDEQRFMVGLLARVEQAERRKHGISLDEASTSYLGEILRDQFRVPSIPVTIRGRTK